MSIISKKKGQFSNQSVYIAVGVAAFLMLVCGGIIMVGLYNLVSPISEGPTSKRPNKRSSAGKETETGMLSPDQVITAFFIELREGKTEDAYGRTSTSFQSHTSLNVFTDMINRNKALIGHLNRRQTSSNATGPNVRSFKMHITGGPNGSCDCTLDISLEDEGWRISRFTVP